MENSRLAKLNPFFDEFSADAIIITDLMNIRYLSGFTGSSALIIALNPEKYVDKKPFFITDGRYDIQSRKQTSGFDIFISNTPHDSAFDICNREKFDAIGFEASNLSYKKYLDLSEKITGKPIPITRNLNEIRKVKDKKEIELIRKSKSIATDSFYQIKPLIKKGVKEKDLKIELEYAFAKNGATKPSFDPIIAFGPNSALPHAIPGVRELEEESLVLIDFGVFSDTYASDETITLYFGKEPSSDIQKIYALVKKAHDEAISNAKPGMKASELDAISRNIIESEGYGKFFNHSLGHSVGLETHDGFSLSSRSDEIIREGMVLTIEPGIYIDEVGGVRLEDMIHITPQGAELLTRLPKTLLENTIT